MVFFRNNQKDEVRTTIRVITAVIVVNRSNTDREDNASVLFVHKLIT